MALDLSLSEIMARLEGQIASLREQIAEHARLEEHHREQKALREAALHKALSQMESLRTAADTAGELDLPAAPPRPQEEDLGHDPSLPRMVARVVEGRPDGEPFGTKSVVQEVNRRFRKVLRRPVDPPAVSLVLRRMSAARRIHQVRAGRPNHESLYVKGPAPRAAKGEDNP